MATSHPSRTYTKKTPLHNNQLVLHEKSTNQICMHWSPDDAQLHYGFASKNSTTRNK